MEIEDKLGLMKCVKKLNTEANKRLMKGKLFVNEECDLCDGYKTKCPRYGEKPPWYGKD